MPLRGGYEDRVGQAEGQLAPLPIQADLHGTVPEAFGDHLHLGAWSQAELVERAKLVRVPVGDALDHHPVAHAATAE
jgi:hypothetical protein